MADASLDDFFAKKDKTKKLKNKGKGFDQVSKKPEDVGKKPDKSSKKDKERNNTSSTTQSVNNNPAQEQVQEEWNEVDDQEKDYSSLRIHSLTIDKEKEEEQLRTEQGAADDGDETHSNEGPQGPWKKSSATVSADAESPDGEKDDEQEEEEVPVAPQPEAPAVTGKYIPPSMRAHMSGQGTTSSSVSRRYNKSVPEMTSELHFPSLSSAIDPSPKGARSQMNDKSFQSVKHGSRLKDDTSRSGVHLDLENKFSALRRNDN